MIEFHVLLGLLGLRETEWKGRQRKGKKEQSKVVE